MPAVLSSLLSLRIGPLESADLLGAVSVFGGVFLVLLLGWRLALRAGSLVASRTRTEVDDLLLHSLSLVRVSTFVLVALAAAARPLPLPALAATIVDAVALAAVTLEVIRFLHTGAMLLVRRLWLRGGPEAEQMSAVIGFLLRVVLWFVGIQLVLANLGVDVTSLVASLGIGGIAVALAVQNILGDMFSSFSIYFDKPFQPGDFIVVGQHMGVVKRVGLKTTRIQALEGEEVIIPNQELTTTRVQNYKRMETRRVEFGFHVPFETPLSSLRALPDAVKEVMGRHEDVTVDRVHVKAIGEYGLFVSCVYILRSTDYTRYMDVQQAINLDILEMLTAQKVAVAYPTRLLRKSDEEIVTRG